MDYKEMNQVLADLDQATHTLEDLYIEGEGEVTDETEHLEEKISGLKELLTQDGIDLLGGWLKAKEDRKKSLKAEKDYITRQMAAIDDTIEFIKLKINQILVATGQEKVKGSRGYSFAATTSVKTEVDKDVLKDKYGFRVEQIMRGLGIPEYIGFSLTASSAKAKELGVLDEEIFHTTETPSVRFTKPRESKEA